MQKYPAFEKVSRSLGLIVFVCVYKCDVWGGVSDICYIM